MSSGFINLQPFRIQANGPDPLRRTLIRAAGPAVERVLAFPTLNEIYAQIQSRIGDDRHFADKALDALSVRYRSRSEELAHIPTEGPLVVVANHPFGGIEGMVLCSLLRRVRPDTKLLANYMLSAIPDLRDTFFFVDPFGTPEAAKRNLASMRDAIDHVNQGGCLGVFPAGEVSHLKLRRRTIDDPPWSKTVGKIVQRTGAAVVPVFFDGRNSVLFQIAGLFHSRLRTALLPREMLKKRSGRIRLRIGKPLPTKRLASFDNPESLTSYLRVRTYVLKPSLRWRDRPRSQTQAIPGQQPIIDALPREQLIDEIVTLPGQQKLLTSGSMDVVIGRIDQLPSVVREIGRLREITFRQVGEGTGRAIDLDRFDQDYMHLVVWDNAKHNIVGAYRLGPTDRILPAKGIDGLYTSTLFHFNRKLLNQISPALELGRSFVHPEYQRSFLPLMLLWQGIGHYIVLNPQYRHLFGTVSISADYSSMTKQLLMSFLENHHDSLPRLTRLLRPKNPPRRQPPRGWEAQEFSTVVRDVSEVNELIADLETDGKQMPVLLRQYLKLNGKLLGFNIDPDFGNVLDGLMLFDVSEIPRPTLNKYLSKEGAASFLAHHGIATPKA